MARRIHSCIIIRIGRETWYSLNSRPYLKLVFGKVNLNSCCVPIFQSLASTVAKIGRGSQLFWMLPWPRPPPIMVQNVVFGKLVSKPSCVPNLKLLASTVAKIRRGSQIFLGCSPGPDTKQIRIDILLNVNSKT